LFSRRRRGTASLFRRSTWRVPPRSHRRHSPPSEQSQTAPSRSLGVVPLRSLTTDLILEPALEDADISPLKPLPRIDTISLGQVVAEDGPLARAWLRIICACWHTNTAYDPSRRRARDQHLEPLTLT